MSWNRGCDSASSRRRKHGLNEVVKLNEIAAFERKCCDTFNWEVTEEPGLKLAHLKVSGSEAIKTEIKSGFEQ